MSIGKETLMLKRQPIWEIFICTTIIFLYGCSGIPKVSESEVSKYEEEYMASNQKNTDWKPTIKWIQPRNIKESCKLYVVINPDDDETIKPDYELYWDGECEDGYAQGLGRIIKKTMLTSVHQIGYYEKGKAIKYCAYFDPLNNWYREAECNYDNNVVAHFVRTEVKENFGDLEVFYYMGSTATPSQPLLVMRTSPFLERIDSIKSYPNFTYLIQDSTANEFGNSNFDFFIRNNKTGKNNGYAFSILKNGQINSGEFIKGVLAQKVQLPQSYFQKADGIYQEVRSASKKALEAQRNALIIKEKYKNKICKDNVHVDFIDNDEYKEICNENEKFSNLQNRIREKLTRIEQQKNVKRSQLNEQRLIAARESEAQAAQRSAMALEQANVNQSIQNMNQNLQMQQLNNNLMMYNTLPKTHNLFIYK